MKKGKTIEVSQNIEEVIKGINKSVNCIKSTMGGQGKNVILMSNDNNDFSQDGVSVANFYHPSDNAYHLIGANIVKDACNQTVKKVGDGTTCTAVLLQGFMNKWIEDKPTDINNYLKDLQVDVNEVADKVLRNSFKIKDDKEGYLRLKDIAKVSSNSQKIGELLYEVYNEVGTNCSINLEVSENRRDSYYELETGVEYKGGYLLNTCINTEDDKCILENVVVIVEPLKVNINKYSDFLSDAKTENTNYLFISPEFDNSFFQAIVNNDIRNVVCIKSPGYGDQIQENYKDIQAFCSDDFTIDKLVVTTHKFTMYNENKSEGFNDRLDKLKVLSRTAEEQFDRVNFLERYHALSGSLVNIYVGGITQAAKSELYYRLEDAVEACKSTIKYGYVIGGGWELYKHRNILDVCTLPATTILSNANLDLLETKENKNYNVVTMQYEDFLESGIIDPALSPIASLENAFASFKLLVNTKYIIING